MRVNTSRPARMAWVSGANGESPAAIRSALTNSRQWTKSGRNSVAKVVLPAPFGPAITKAVGIRPDTISVILLAPRDRQGLGQSVAERARRVASPGFYAPAPGRVIPGL